MKEFKEISDRSREITEEEKESVREEYGQEESQKQEKHETENEEEKWQHDRLSFLSPIENQQLYMPARNSSTKIKEFSQ